MKKILFTLALLLIASNAVAVEPIDFSKSYAMIVSGRPAPGVAAAGCNTSTDYCGSKTHYGSTISAGKNAVYMFKAQASCSGTLTAAYVWNDYAWNAEGSVCIYNSTSTEPVVTSTADSKVACSATISTGGTSGLKTANFASGSVVKDNNYWVLVFVSNSSTDGYWELAQSNTADRYSISGIGWTLGSEPASFNGLSFTKTASYSPISAYATIGP